MTDYEQLDRASTTPTEIESAKASILLQAGVRPISYIDLYSRRDITSEALHVALAELVRCGEIFGLDPYTDEVRSLDDLIYRRAAKRVRVR